MRIVSRPTEWKDGYQHGLSDAWAVFRDALKDGGGIAQDMDQDTAEAVIEVLTLVAEKVVRHDFPLADA